jgi:hypothetical protein
VFTLSTKEAALYDTEKLCKEITDLYPDIGLHEIDSTVDFDRSRSITAGFCPIFPDRAQWFSLCPQTDNGMRIKRHLKHA